MKKRLNNFIWSLYEGKKIRFNLYKLLRSCDSVLPRIYGLPKIHKPNVLSRPIVSFVGSATYNLSKFLKNVLSPVVGTTKYSVKNSKEFVDLLSSIKIKDFESQVSFDVVSLLTSVPIDLARSVVLKQLSSNCTLVDCTDLCVDDIMKAFDMCVEATFFVYNQTVYQQIFGCPMGSPLSPVLAYMVEEVIEQNAIETFFKPPSIWVRYVDDVYSIVETNQIALFHDHLNTISSSVNFTKELESKGTLSFLDVAVIRKTDGTLSADMYRKPTHTGRYLSFSSHHPLNQKLSIVRTLYSRANNIISDENKKIQEFHHVSDILKSNGFPSHKRSFSFNTNSVASQQSNQQF